jgi:hypothetical protein
VVRKATSLHPKRTMPTWSANAQVTERDRSGDHVGNGQAREPGSLGRNACEAADAPGGYERLLLSTLDILPSFSTCWATLLTNLRTRQVCATRHARQAPQAGIGAGLTWPLGRGDL